MTYIWVCACALFLSALLAGSVMAQKLPDSRSQKATQKPMDAPVKGDWAIACKSATDVEGLDCQMSRAVVLKKIRKLVVRFTITLPAVTKKPVMLIQLPYGLYLPAGVRLAVDDNAPIPMVVQTCDQKGCYGGSPVPEEMLTAMKKGNTLRVTVQNLKKKPVAFAVPLDGFTKAFKQMETR